MEPRVIFASVMVAGLLSSLVSSGRRDSAVWWGEECSLGGGCSMPHVRVAESEKKTTGLTQLHTNMAGGTTFMANGK